MTSELRQLINRATYSSVVVNDEGYTEYKGFGINPYDPRAFISKSEIDQYLNMLLEKENDLTN